MSSYKTGKEDIIQYIKDNFSASETCLDVGACDGMYA